jgi:peptidoglycan-N-acetylglucosamine deacetylase
MQFFMPVVFLIFLIYFVYPLFSSGLDCQQIAISFDDFPMHTTILFEKKERAEIYARKLEEAEIQAVFFCIGEQLSSHEDAEPILAAIAQQLLANHSYNHLHLSEINIETFKEQLISTDLLIAHQPNFRSWFRFPYLDCGDRLYLGGNSKKRTQAYMVLQQNGYQHGYVTLNTFDWYVNSQLGHALQEGKRVNWDQLRQAYISLLDDWIEQQHTVWRQTLKIPFIHVLLLHQNDLNALFFEDIIALIKKKKWEIVSPDLAFENPIPFLAKLVGSKVKTFKKIDSLSLEYIDCVLKQHTVFEEQEKNERESV